MTDALWDDSAFKRRVEVLAKRRGLSVADALRAAGITRYFSRTSGGRSINLLLNLARALNVQPVELLGLNEPLAAPAMPVDSEKLQRILCVTKAIMAQMAAVMYVASDDSGADPAVLMETVIGQVNGNNYGGGSPMNKK